MLNPRYPRYPGNLNVLQRILIDHFTKGKEWFTIYVWKIQEVIKMAVDQKPLASQQKSWLLKPLLEPSWAMIHGEFPLFCWQSKAWRSAMFGPFCVRILSITAPANMGNTWGTLPWPTCPSCWTTSWAKGAPWPQHHFLASPQRWNTSSSSWWSSPQCVGVEQHGTTQDPTTKLYWWFQAHWKHNCI